MRSHMLECLRLELCFANEPVAWAEQSRFTAFARGEAIDVIEAVFEEFDRPDEVARIDRLEVDLGAMRADATDLEWADRLREGLRCSLHERLAPTSDSLELGDERHLSRTQGDFEQLWHWLNSGLLPWQAPSDSNAVDLLATRVLAAHGTALARRLRAAPARELALALRRIARQWPAHLLAQLSDVWTEHGAPDALYSRVRFDGAAGSPFPIGAAGSADASSSAGVLLRAPLWERWLQKTIDGPSIDVMRAHLDDQLLSMQFADDTAWSTLIRADSDWVAARLLQHGRSAEWRRRFASHSSPRQWRDALHLWLAPAEAETLETMLDRAELWVLDGPHSAATLTPLLREWTIAHVLVDRLGRSTAEACLDSLIVRRAELDGLDPGAVARGLIDGEPIGSATHSDTNDEPATAISRRAQLHDQLLSMRFADEAVWSILIRAESDWVAARLLQHGRGTRWRRRFASHSSPRQWRDALHLWFSPPDIEILECLLERAELWVLEGPHGALTLAPLLREWILAHVLLDQGGRSTADGCVASLIVRRAEYDDFDSRALAQHLHASWQRDTAVPAAARARILALLSRAANLGTGHRGAVSDELPRPDAHSMQGRHWLDALALWVPHDDVAFLAAVIVQPEAWVLQGPHGAATFKYLLFEWLLAHVLFGCHGRSTAEACLESLVVRRAELDGLDPGAIARQLVDGWPTGMAAHPERSRLVAILCRVEARAGKSLPAGASDTAERNADASREPAMPTTTAQDARPWAVGFDALPRRLPAAARRALAVHLEMAPASAELLEELSGDDRRALLHCLLPDEAPSALRTMDHLWNACRDSALPIRWPVFERIGWQFLMRELFEEGRHFTVEGFVQRWLANLFAALDGTDARYPFGSMLAEPAIETPEVSLFEHRINRALAKALRSDAVSRDEPVPRRDPALPGSVAARGAAIYIGNAGLVLATPYLPRLFARLGMIAHGSFIDSEAAARAALLLQFLVDGTQEAPEHTLPLNKLMCGIDLNTPIGREIDVTATERQAVEGLLNAMIRNWPSIGHTSIAGLRESFMRREGALTCKGDAWELLVEPRSFDMLLDQLPWGFKTTKYPWMERVLHVEWR